MAGRENYRPKNFHHPLMAGMFGQPQPVIDIVSA